jgi:hypothetical protein
VVSRGDFVTLFKRVQAIAVQYFYERFPAIGSKIRTVGGDDLSHRPSVGIFFGRESKDCRIGRVDVNRRILAKYRHRVKIRR